MQGSALEQEEKVKSGIFLQSQARLLWLQECCAPVLAAAGACLLIPLLPSLHSLTSSKEEACSALFSFFFFLVLSEEK